MKKNLYDILGVDESATAEEIKEAYRNSSKENHPDKGGSSEKMAEINHAHAILINPDKRERYDNTGEEYDQPFDQKFNSFVQEVFMALVDQCKENDIAHVDLIKAFKKHVLTVEGNIYKNKAEYKKQISKLEKVLKRVKSSKKNLIGNVIQMNIDDLKKKIKACESDLEFIGSCKEVLESYNYEIDPKQEENYSGFYIQQL